MRVVVVTTAVRAHPGHLVVLQDSLTTTDPIQVRQEKEFVIAGSNVSVEIPVSFLSVVALPNRYVVDPSDAPSLLLLVPTIARTDHQRFECRCYSRIRWHVLDRVYIRRQLWARFGKL